MSCFFYSLFFGRLSFINFCDKAATVSHLVAFLFQPASDRPQAIKKLVNYLPGRKEEKEDLGKE